MSNEDYVKQGRSDKLLGRGYKKEGSLGGRRSGNLFSGARLQGRCLHWRMVVPISVFASVASGLRGGGEYEKTRGEVLRCP